MLTRRRFARLAALAPLALSHQRSLASLTGLAGGEHRFRLLYTNDFHSAFDPVPGYWLPGSPRLGGATRLASLVDRKRAESATSFLVGNANSWLSSEWCDIQQPFLTQVRGAGAYTIPRIDVQVSATLQSKPGTQLAANYNVPSAVAAITLGRPLSGNAANTTVNISQPGKLYGDRITQVDMRIAKILRFGRTRTNVGLDIYNLFNSNVPLTYVNVYGTTWGNPQSVLDARFAKFSAQIDF